MQGNRIINTLNQVVSYKFILFFVMGITSVTSLLVILYLQNAQMQALITSVSLLQNQISVLDQNLVGLAKQKDLQITLLEESIKNLQAASSHIDSETIRAQTERQELYIKAALICVGSITALSVGYLLLNGMHTGLALKSFLPKTVLALGKKYGFFVTVEHYEKRYQNTTWKVDIIDSGQDVHISYKTDGSGEFINALEALSKHLSTLNLPPRVITDILSTPAADGAIDIINSTPTVADFLLKLPNL